MSHVFALLNTENVTWNIESLDGLKETVPIIRSPGENDIPGGRIFSNPDFVAFEMKFSRQANGLAAAGEEEFCCLAL
jgi:hypothetical protein